MPSVKGLTYERAKECISYDPETGNFTWLKTLNAFAIAGKPIPGSIGGRGYPRLQIDRATHSMHRVAWLLMTGEWPAETIDHINCIKTDNRWANLRAATVTQNLVSRPGHSKRGLPKGVNIKASGRFGASIKVNGAALNLGTFDTAEEAHRAYVIKAKEVHGEFAHP